MDDLEVAECLGGRGRRADELLGLFVVVVPGLVHLGARLRLHAVHAHGVVGRLEAAVKLIHYLVAKLDFAPEIELLLHQRVFVY